MKMVSYMQMKGSAFAIILIYLHLRYDISLPPYVHREHAYARECHGVQVRIFLHGDASVEFLILRLRADWQLCGHALHGKRGTTASRGDRFASRSTVPGMETLAPLDVIAYAWRSTSAAPYSGASVVVRASKASRAGQIAVETKGQDGCVPASALGPRSRPSW
jgi:hypothetical protein